MSQGEDLSLRRGRFGAAVLAFVLAVLAGTTAAAHALGPDPGPAAAAPHALHPDSYEPAPELTAPAAPPASPTVTVRTVTVPATTTTAATTTTTPRPPATPAVPPQHLAPSSEPTVSPVRTQPAQRVASPARARPTPRKRAPAPARLHVPVARGSLVYVAAEHAGRLGPELPHLAGPPLGLDRRLVVLAALALLTLVAASATFLRLAFRLARP